jgi:FG-GAP-like repeat
MRFVSLLACLLLLPVAALAAGTVGFNVKWYSTGPWPFNDIVDYPGFEATTAIVIADLNRDGIPDVAYSYSCCDDGSSGGGVIVKLGTGGGNLGPDVPYKFGQDVLGELKSADINGDGWLDFMFPDVFYDSINVFLNNGDGTFRYAGKVGLGGIYSGSFTLGDFNHDGKIDLAEIGCDQPQAGFPGGANCTLNIGLGDGSGLHFTPSQSIQLAGSSYNLQSADINGDGKLDLVFVRGSVGVIRWGRGDGTFSGPTYLKPSTTDPMDAVAVADFNNDGRLDVALLSGNPCRPDPDRGPCGQGNVNNVWMYKNNGGTSFTLTTHTQFTAQAGMIVPADINGDLNQDLLHYNQFASGIYPVLGAHGGYDYVLGVGNDMLGTQGTLPGDWISAVTFRDMDGDSRADYAVIDWGANQLGIGIQTGGWKNCTPPSSANLAAKICGISNGATVSSPLLVKASGNSPAGVNQLQVWIDGKKQYVKWGDQLSKRFTLAKGKHRISVVANDKFIGSAKTIVNVTVP